MKFLFLVFLLSGCAATKQMLGRCTPDPIPPAETDLVCKSNNEGIRVCAWLNRERNCNEFRIRVSCAGEWETHEPYHDTECRPESL